MIGTNTQVKSLVIQGYLNDRSRDQIAIEVGISAGKASGIIKDWAKEIGEPFVEDMRDFAFILKKTGTSVKECAEGYRMIQLLKKLGINCETDGFASYDNNDNNDGDANKEIMLFLDGIYLFCKRLGISPTTVFSWIKDLQDFCSHIHDNNNHCNSLAQVNEGYDQDSHIEGEEYGHQQQWPYTKPNKQNPPAEKGILFISRVSHLIGQTKKEYGMLKGDKQQLIKEIEELDKKRDKAEQNLKQTLQKEKFALSHIGWFSKLKEDLFDGHGIKI